MGKSFSKNHAALIFCLISLLLTFTDISSTDAALQEDELFEKAYNYYLSYEPAKAIETFDLFLRKYPASSSRDAALFWKARSLVQTNKKVEAVAIFRGIIEEFPSSHFRSFSESELENINSSDNSETVSGHLFKSSEISVASDRSSDDNDSKLKKALANDRKQKAELAEYQKKIQLFEEAVLKADEDKHICISSLEDEKKRTEDLSKKTKNLFDLTEENQRLKEELKLKEDQKLRLSQEAISRTVEENIICLEALENEKMKTEDLSKKTKSLADLTIENQRLKEELKLKEDQIRLEAKNNKENIPIIEDYKNLKASLDRCDMKLKAFTEKDNKKEINLAKASDEKIPPDKEQSSSEKNDEKIEDTRLSMQKKPVSQQDTADIETKISKAKIDPDNNTKNLQKEASVLPEELKHTDIPVTKADDKQYSSVQIMDEYQTASDVEKKLKQKTVFWKKGNAQEDFLMEQLLLNKAQELEIKEDVALYNMLIKKYSFTEKEEAYLLKYLTIEKLISTISGNIYIPEADIRKYYEDNKQEFLVSPSEKMVNVLSVGYNAENEIERSMVIIDIQISALKGDSLSNLQRKHQNVVSLKQYGYSQLPDGIKEEASKLEDGDISDIISKDNEYIIIQTWTSMPIYEKYEDVHYVIKNNLLEKSRSNSQVLNKWLKEIQNTDKQKDSLSNEDIALDTDKEADDPQTKSVAIKKKRVPKTKKTTLRKKL